ncbi:MAG: hypothetical protein WD992_00200 [Candidatus Levyibacteriota bacterium]
MKKIVLFDIDYTLFDTDLFKESDLTKHSLYEEVVGVLVEIATHATLGIFSEGDMEFQRNKLMKTDIMNHFNEEDIHIFTEKTTPIPQVLNKYKDYKVFLVDDRPSILGKVKKNSPSVFTIFIDREKRIWKGDEPIDYSADATVSTLNEVIPLIVNN